MLRSRKLFVALAAGVLLALGAVAGVAQNANQTLSSLLSTDLIQVYRYTTGAITYASPDVVSNYARSTALLYTTTGTAGTTTGTAEQTLATYSLPASTLNLGTKLIVRASFSAAATSNNKTFKCYFGASVVSSGVLTTNAKNGDCQVVVTKTGASAQIVWGKMMVDTTAITDYVNVGSDTDTSAIVIKFTGTDGSSAAADIVLNDFSVERLGN